MATMSMSRFTVLPSLLHFTGVVFLQTEGKTVHQQKD